MALSATETWFQFHNAPMNLIASTLVSTILTANGSSLKVMPIFALCLKIAPSTPWIVPAALLGAEIVPTPKMTWFFCLVWERTLMAVLGKTVMKFTTI